MRKVTRNSFDTDINTGGGYLDEQDGNANRVLGFSEDEEEILAPTHNNNAGAARRRNRLLGRVGARAFHLHFILTGGLTG